MIVTQDSSDGIWIVELHENYLAWCDDNKVEKRATKENMGKVIAKLFNRPERKSKQVKGQANYNYQQLAFVTNETREKFGDKVKLPDFMSIKFEEEVITIYIPTMIYFDNTLAEHLVFTMYFVANSSWKQGDETGICMSWALVNLHL